ncbi:hypothetical protein F4818DRAFT_101752 [Hypoxylon cercidicola]|nr:hypothetical protein F4818DRAFT_101752 [Hypoxylon cercidicola]
MTPTVEYSDTVGVDRDHIDYGSFRKWLTPIWIRAMIHTDIPRAPEKVGEAFGFAIKRSAICETFHKSMEPPHEETRALAFTLFDRYGRLKREIREHIVRRGSGVWNKEMDDGEIVLVEDVRVEKQHRRQGIGKQLVLRLLQAAMSLRSNTRFAFAFEGSYPDDQGEGGDSMETGVVRFLRSLQFRRVGLTPCFALARDQSHPSHQLPSHEDPDPVEHDDTSSDSGSEDEMILCGPGFTQTRIEESEFGAPVSQASARAIRHEDKLTWASILSRRHPLHYAAKALADKDALEFVQSSTGDGSTQKLDLEATNGHGDTILHVAAKASKPASVSWIARCPSDTNLSTMRNHDGYTPMEALQAQMEDSRVRERYGSDRWRCVADKFDGFGDDCVACLLSLSGLETPTPDQREKAKFGCSCGKCLGGFLSPRMMKNLQVTANLNYGFLRSSRPGDQSWNSENEDMLVHLPEGLQLQFRRNESLQSAFIELVGAVTECLADNEIPRKANVTKRLRGSRLWPQVENEYFSNGGTVAAVMDCIIDKAKDHDIEVGEPLSDEQLEDLYRGLDGCRNDLEFEFVRRHCVDDALPKEEEDRLP